jgi:CDP-glucose 4,6-dehydratase
VTLALGASPGESLRGRRVLVTGHTGFKGSWLSRWLLDLGADVTGYALEPPTTPALFDLLGLAQHMPSVTADIRDADHIRRSVADARPDVVFHLAAYPIVRAAYEAPAETFDVNAIGTARVLDAVRAYGEPCAVVAVSSDKCYLPADRPAGHVESDPLGGHDPYSASKAAMEVLVDSYRSSYFVEQSGQLLASGRAGNVIGGGDWAPDRLLPDCARAWTADEEVVVRNPTAIRPWQHVLEPLAGYLLLAERLLNSGRDFAEPWNFGSRLEDARPVADVVELASKAWDDAKWRVADSAGDRPENPVLRLSSDKAIERLGWAPVWSVDEAVERTVRWYQTCAGADPAAVESACRGDISAYVRAYAGSQRG